MGNLDFVLTKCGYNCRCPIVILNISFLCPKRIYQNWLYPKQNHPAPPWLSQRYALCPYCIHIIPKTYPIFYIISNVYTSNIPISHSGTSCHRLHRGRLFVLLSRGEPGSDVSQPKHWLGTAAATSADNLRLRARNSFECAIIADGGSVVTNED